MDPHPDFAEVLLPRDLALGAFHMTPLSPKHVDEDLAAVTATSHLMDGLFGDWPTGLTRDYNLVDLAWHEREFTARRSFSWIVRDADAVYIGCFYLFPELGSRARAKATFWLCDIPDREGVAKALKADLSAWLDTVLPAGIALTWVTRPAL